MNQILQLGGGGGGKPETLPNKTSMWGWLAFWWVSQWQKNGHNRGTGYLCLLTEKYGSLVVQFRRSLRRSSPKWFPKWSLKCHLRHHFGDHFGNVPLVPSLVCSKNCGPRQGRVRQLALRASLESVGDSDHKQVAWSLYKREVLPVCIPKATGDKGGEMNIPAHVGYTGPCNNLSQTGRGGFSPCFIQHFSGQFHISPQGFVIGCFNYPLGEVQSKDANLQHSTASVSVGKFVSPLILV